MNLTGKRTYILGGVAVVWAVVGYFMGYLPLEQAQTYLWAGLTAMGLRAAISNK